MRLRDFSGKRIGVAISGGVDSVVLLHYMKSQEVECGFSLFAVHCEHGIRGQESLEDEAFVRRFCQQLGVPSFTFSQDCPARAKREKESLETVARYFRYESFARLIAEEKLDYIATAHHLDDEAETVLFRLARGTTSGVKGMVERKGYILRPLLSWTRKDVEEYARKFNLAFRVDSTNGDLDITRNKIRAEVLPKLEECVAGAAKNIARFANRYAGDDEFLYELARELLTKKEGGFTLSFSEKKPLFSRACLLAMKGMGIEKDYTAVHLEDLFGLQSLERGAKICLPKGVVAIKKQEGILFTFEDKKSVVLPEPKKYSKKGFDGGRYEVIISKKPILPENEWKVLRFDEGKLPTDGVFRFRKDGDEIESFGGRKSLKKFLNERNIPVEERGALPLIASKDGKEVYAICGVEISTLVKVTEDTKEVAFIAIGRK